ncbi:YoaK family protein [Cellulomonas sp. S1-8]|uniref:YoaK family protein n=1 Tax=Cellulomonas sp. S1-8 TaxID=2904790 RepID=UPI002244ADC0|nr:YoaK family protein [Cellulomonas sp. S1-8]UZN04150.1 DUF1275 domain-containing protein [Cellulomonas sp. S1-8]
MTTPRPSHVRAFDVDHVPVVVVPERLRLWLMMLLTFVTGVVDVVGYLGLDQVFTGNMTGNVVILAMGLAGASTLPVAGPLLATTGFLAGAAVAGAVLGRSPNGWNRRVTVLLGVGVLVLLAAGTILVLEPGAGGSAVGVALAATIALHMGSQALIARHLAVKDMTTVVITSTMTSLAGESWHGKAGPRWLNRRTGAIAMMFLGASIGAVLLLFVHISVPVFVGAGLTALVVLLGARRWAG